MYMYTKLFLLHLPDNRQVYLLAICVPDILDELWILLQYALVVCILFYNIHDDHRHHPIYIVEPVKETIIYKNIGRLDTQLIQKIGEISNLYCEQMKFWPHEYSLSVPVCSGFRKFQFSIFVYFYAI